MNHSQKTEVLTNEDAKKASQEQDMAVKLLKGYRKK